VIRYHPRALARLALATAFPIATLLAIPDAISLIPAAADPLRWAVRVIGIWLSALILWFVGFQCVLYLVRLLTLGITIKSAGLKLWRFGRLIPWASIAAVSVEPQVVFSRIFSLKPFASRLALYIEGRPGARFTTQTVPSFLYQPEQFAALLQVIFQSSFGFLPDSEQVLVAPAETLGRLKRLFTLMRWQKIALSLVISLSLLLFLGRKCAVHFVYALGNKALQQGYPQQARRDYELVISMDPTFAVAWHNLASAEFRMGEVEKACQHWQQAISLKPDFVEPKVSLSFVYMHRRQYEQAANLLERALRVAPRDANVLINQADLNMRLGHTRQAMKIARLVLTQSENNALAICLLAQGKTRLGNPRAALDLIHQASRHSSYPKAGPFCQMVAGEAHMALGELSQAEVLFRAVLNEQPLNVDALLDLAHLRLSRSDFDGAGELLTEACTLNPDDPWPWLMFSQIAARRGERAQSLTYLEKASRLPDQDARSLASAARQALELGKVSKSIELARRSIKLEPVTPEALAVLEQTARLKN